MKGDMEASQEMPFVSLVHLCYSVQALMWIVCKEGEAYLIFAVPVSNS